MGSKGRIPPPHMRLPPPVGIPPLDMLPPPEILEQKLTAQHMEMERLASENRRLAATHGSLRQQLAAAQQDLQILEARIGAVKTEKEQNRRGLFERIAKMEGELKAAEHVPLELQQARTEARNLAELRLELLSKVQKMNTDIQRVHVDVQQIPALLSELDRLRQEFQKYRATYEHERKVYLDHVESLQVMDKEYRSMAEEVAKLRAELSITANTERIAVYGGAVSYGEDASGRNPTGRSSYEDSYGAPQVHAAYPTSGAAATTPVGAGGSVAASGGGAPSYGAPQSGSTGARPGYDASRAPGQETHRVSPYDPQGVAVYNAQRLPTGYDAPYNGGAPYNNMQRPLLYNPQRAPSGYEVPQTASYPHPVQPPANVAHALVAPPGPRAGAGAGAGVPDLQARGANAARR